MTTQLDLEHGSVIVWGRSEDSYFRYHLYGAGDRLLFWLQKGDLQFVVESDCVQVCQAKPLASTIPLEHLSLGVHKKQDWQLMCRRQDPEELVPLFYALGQWVNAPLPVHLNQGSLSLIPSLVPPDFESHFQKFFQVAFSAPNGLLFPRLEDSDGWGFNLPDSDASTNTASLAVALYHHLRSLLFAQKNNQFSFLPQLPKAFHCGRLIGLQTHVGIFDLEWSKKCIRRVVIHAKADAEIALHFRHVKTVRLCENTRGGNTRDLVANNRLNLENGSVYLLDNFQS